MHLLAMQEIAGSLLSLLQAATGSEQASVATKERLNRALQILSPIAMASLPPEPAPQSSAPERTESSNGNEVKDVNGEVASGEDAAKPGPASMEEHLLRIPPGMDVLDR